MQLHDAIRHHHLIPVALGSGMASLAHEVSAMYHQWFMDSGSSRLMQRIGACMVSFLSDKGTEKGICYHPPTKFGELLPHFASIVFE
eukprot:10053073-Alexandrium_andersonii.AAC.1